MKCFSNKPTFTNWSGNIRNNTDILYPINDADLIRMIAKAVDKEKVIRVIGSAHSISGTVCQPNESKLLLISLKKYRLGLGQPEEQIVIDHEKMTVMVNAGVTLGALYERLDDYSYFLETQPASPAFTIGGVVSMPVHGGRLGGSLIADTIIGMTLIDMYGTVTKSETDVDMDLYRLSLGMLGIITSVTFRIHQMKDIKCDITTYQNVFSGNRVDGKQVDEFFTDTINKCLSTDKEWYYNHSFLDFHNNKLLTVNWKSSDINPIIDIDVENAEKITVLPTDIIQNVFYPDYRESPSYLKILGKIVRLGVEGSVVKNRCGDNDMLWVTTGTRVYFMSYFIPIHTAGEPIDLTKLYRAFEIVKNQIDTAIRDKKTFNIDFPTDIRFVVSNNRCKASPIYNPEKKIVYMVVDLTTGPSNIELMTKNINKHYKQLNSDFREFYGSVEREWRELGGMAHYSKLFGFTDSNSDPFDESGLKLVFDPELKSILKNKAQPVFVNRFVRNLIE